MECLQFSLKWVPEDDKFCRRLAQQISEGYCNHANIWKFIEYLQNDHHDDAGHVGIRHPINKSDMLNLRHVGHTVRNYDDYKERREVDI